jgi:hypothetical protein
MCLWVESWSGGERLLRSCLSGQATALTGVGLKKCRRAGGVDVA